MFTIRRRVPLKTCFGKYNDAYVNKFLAFFFLYYIVLRQSTLNTKNSKFHSRMDLYSDTGNIQETKIWYFVLGHIGLCKWNVILMHGYHAKTVMVYHLVLKQNSQTWWWVQNFIVFKFLVVFHTSELIQDSLFSF